jgi:sigma-54 dependent transcriptional regulator, acetoin dehydrogenase operon transcriptional activator AcoR
MAGEPSLASSSALKSNPGLVLVFASDQERALLPAVVPLSAGSTVFGREPPPGGGVKLPLNSVSRMHARIDRSTGRGGVTIFDLRSRNGTLVRGQPISPDEGWSLESGDDVRIGDAIFVYVDDDIEAHRPSPHATGLGPDAYPHAGIACGPATRKIFDALEPIALANIPVLVLGETGTGKELVAEAIHAASKRTGALRALNCAAMPANLVESELFGFKKGAFSGADKDKAGIVRAAHGGTLFLDEIGDLPLEIQPKLLRLLESNEISPVGSAQTERVDVRFVCATHANLAQLVEEKKFRADLYSRIRGYVVTLPPLRDRKQDLYLLVQSLLTRLERPNAPMTIAFMVALLRYHWPFNIRELFAVLRRAVALCPAGGEVLDTKHLPEEVLVPPSPRLSSASMPASGSSVESRPEIPTADALRDALKQNDGNVAALARIFKRDRSLIHRWLKQHGIDPRDFRS